MVSKRESKLRGGEYITELQHHTVLWSKI